jgi:phage shock protein E
MHLKPINNNLITKIMFGIFKKTDNQKNSEVLETRIKEGAFLVDVRNPQEYEQGSVESAVNIPLETVQNQLHKFKNKKHIIVFCRSGNRSGQAKLILEQHGFTNVTNGGAWTELNQIVNK